MIQKPFNTLEDEGKIGERSVACKAVRVKVMLLENGRYDSKHFSIPHTSLIDHGWVAH